MRFLLLILSLFLQFNVSGYNINSPQENHANKILTPENEDFNERSCILFRYYDCDSGSYISQDPISIAGGLNIYAYVSDPNSFVDRFGLKPNANKPNQDVYALYKQGSKEPYYVGISQDADVRLKQHEKSGRFDPTTDEMKVLKSQRPYAEARAHEQFNIEKYNTIDTTNPKANQQNSFRKNRTDANGIEYKQEYDNLKKGGGCG